MFWDDMCGRPYNNKNKQDCLITVCACLYSNKQLIQDESNKRAAALSNSELHCQGGQLSKHMAASATPHSNSTLPIFGIVLWAEELDSNKIREKKEHPTLIGVATLVSISKVAASSHELVLMRLPQNIMMISKGMESNLRRKGLSQGKAPGDRRFHLRLCGKPEDLLRQLLGRLGALQRSPAHNGLQLLHPIHSCFGIQLTVSLKSRAISSASIVQIKNPDCGYLHHRVLSY